LNQRPSGPQPDALPNCATPRSPAQFRAGSVRGDGEHVFVMRELRTCGGCGEAKELSEFAWRRKERGQRDNMCRECRAAYKRAHYLSNKQRHIDQARVRKQVLARERTIYLLTFFESHPCIDCGETDPVVLEFDHVETKSFDICQALPYRSWQSILEEIEKCEVACANCHRRRTARRRGALRDVLRQQPHGED
jgi:hypothetical protein